MKDVNGFDISENNNKEMITYFEGKSNLWKKKHKNYKTLISSLEPIVKIVKIVFIRAATTFLVSSVIGVGLLVVPKPTGFACALSLSKKVIYRRIWIIYVKWEKQWEKGQQTIKSFDKLYRIRFRDNLIDKENLNLFASFWIFFLVETKFISI